MKVIADTTIDLPFKLDFCAQGGDIEPLDCRMGEWTVTMYFPPSLSETTDGQGIFGEWAWWTGRRLRVYMEREAPVPTPSPFQGEGRGEVESSWADTGDVERLRDSALAAGDETLRRFLNAYRARFNRADVHPVRIDLKTMDLSEVLADGTHRALVEPVASFFYQSLPSEAPLQASVNSTTLAALTRDVRDGYEPSIAAQLDLDAEALENQGEFLRADLVRGLARQQME